MADGCLGEEGDGPCFRTRSPARDHPFIRAVAFLGLFALVSGCAGRARRSFVPAAERESREALSAWRQAVERADSLGPSKLLYNARLSQGLLHVSGTLAVRQGPGNLEATLTGPFGSPVARYADGALLGEGVAALAFGPDELRALLGGVWRGEAPEVAGIDAGDALLRWSGAEDVEGVFDVAEARFKSLRVAGAQGTILATYSGSLNPWPERIDVEEVRSGSKLRLKLLAREPLEE